MPASRPFSGNAPEVQSTPPARSAIAAATAAGPASRHGVNSKPIVTGNVDWKHHGAGDVPEREVVLARRTQITLLLSVSGSSVAIGATSNANTSCDMSNRVATSSTAWMKSLRAPDDHQETDDGLADREREGCAIAADEAAEIQALHLTRRFGRLGAFAGRREMPVDVEPVRDHQRDREEDVERLHVDETGDQRQRVHPQEVPQVLQEDPRVVLEGGRTLAPARHDNDRHAEREHGERREHERRAQDGADPDLVPGAVT